MRKYMLFFRKGKSWICMIWKLWCAAGEFNFRIIGLTLILKNFKQKIFLS